MLKTAREIACLSYEEAAARLGCDADWLVRVETGFAAVAPEEVARVLVEYGVREARAAGTIIDMARRMAAPPPWLARTRPESPRPAGTCCWSGRGHAGPGPRLLAYPVPGPDGGLLP